MTLPTIFSDQASAASTAAQLSLLTVVFVIDGQQYALPVSDVREVVRLPALLTLAGAPPVIAGILNFRGTYLPVIDGRRLIGSPLFYDLNSQVIIAGANEHGNALLGLLVDQVEMVRSFSRDQCFLLDKRASEVFLRSLLRSPDGTAMLMDLDALLALAPALNYAQNAQITSRD